MATAWTADRVLKMASGYREAGVLAAAAELELFDALRGRRLGASEIAARVRGNVRAVAVLLDALAAMGLLKKSAGCYSVPADVVSVLTAAGGRTVLAMTQHDANCMRRWAQLARVARTGRPCSPTEAATIMPFDSMPRILRGRRLVTTTTFLPTNVSGA